MLRVLLAPRWAAATLVLVAVVATFVTLGRWQVQRAQDQRVADRVMAERAAAGAPAVPLASLYIAGVAVPDDALGRRVTVDGTYDPRFDSVVPGRQRDGRDGFWVLAGLRSGTAVVPVVRGWAPDRAAGAAADALRAPDGAVTVTGVVEASEPASDASGSGPLPPGSIPFVGSALLLSTWDVPARDLMQGFVRLETEQTTPASPLADTAGPAAGLDPVPPARISTDVGIARHWSYALQWWLFGAAALWFWYAAVHDAHRRRQDRGSRPPAPGSVDVAGTARSTSST